ncbi:MAG TPA: DUF1249 domain-containing protein [Gammaproteobacteria bacterium]
MELSVSPPLVDSLIVPQCVYRPGSFTGLMTIYESNFIKLRRLVEDFDALREPLVSSVPDDCDLYCELKRREPYTTTIRLTYWFDDPDGRRVPDPDLTVRVYHDARLVEAVEGREQHRHRKLQELARVHAAELDRRWCRNMMLNKWLDYLLDMGHRLG